MQHCTGLPSYPGIDVPFTARGLAWWHQPGAWREHGDLAEVAEPAIGPIWLYDEIVAGDPSGHGRRNVALDRSARHIFLIATYRRTSGRDLTAITPSPAPAAAMVIAVTYPSVRITFSCLQRIRDPQH